jgi:hypothetical protein
MWIECRIIIIGDMKVRHGNKHDQDHWISDGIPRWRPDQRLDLVQTITPGVVVTEVSSEKTLTDKIVNPQGSWGIQYLVRWVGYGKDHNEWLPWKALEDMAALDIWKVENGLEV